MQPSEDDPEQSPVAQSRAGDRAYKLIVAYDGTNYCGWQRQPDQPTVQKQIEKAIGKVLGHSRWPARGSSRTDTGVHAIGQVVAFKTSQWRAPAERWTPALNTVLPDDIVVRSATEVPCTFNPLANCTGKRYRYRIYASRIADPLDGRFHWWVKRRLNVTAMRAAALHLLGEHDFAGFETNGSPRQNTIRTVRAIDIQSAEHLDGQQVIIEVEADGFLYNMVRNIVGTLVIVGRERQHPEWITEVLISRDRRMAGQTAPPQGLHLLEVYFAS
jgi:tRNA pseudouridine38-40 synthase